jgi:hypothetical protein
MRQAFFSRALSTMVDSTASDLMKVNDRVWTSQPSPYSISQVSNCAKLLARAALAVTPVASETRKISFKPTETPVGGAQEVSSSSVYKMAGEAMFGMCSLSMLKVEASIAASSPFPEGKEGQVVVVLVAGRGAVKLLTVARNSKEEVASRPLMLEEGVNLRMEMVGNRRMEKLVIQELARLRSLFGLFGTNDFLLLSRFLVWRRGSC